MRQRDEKWDMSIPTEQIVDLLEDNGFTKTDETDRYLDYEKDGLTVVLDFDPYMHLDETDDEICYEAPVYVMYQDWDYHDHYHYVRNLEELTEVINGDY